MLQPRQVRIEINRNPPTKDKAEKLFSGCIAENLMGDLAKVCVISSEHLSAGHKEQRPVPR